MSKIIKTTPADENHNVLTIAKTNTKYMKQPCSDCPWKKSAVGEFPAEAFRISAHTSYDMNDKTFGCHSSGTEQTKTCAGFLLYGADHNFAVRLGISKGEYDLSRVTDGGHDLFRNYKEMAVANGVDPDDERLALSRTD